MQGLHEVAYTGGLSKPMICPEGALGNLTADRLGEFVQRNYTASRMVLSGAGVQQVPSAQLPCLIRVLCPDQTCPTSRMSAAAGKLKETLPPAVLQHVMHKGDRRGTSPQGLIVLRNLCQAVGNSSGVVTATHVQQSSGLLSGCIVQGHAEKILCCATEGAHEPGAAAAGQSATGWQGGQPQVRVHWWRLQVGDLPNPNVWE